MNIHKRFWPVDNADVNRMFPGYDKGEATQRIAADIFEAVSSYDYGIQLASFYLRGKFLPTCASPTRANSRASRLRWRRCSACRARFCTSHRRLTTPHSTTTGKCGTRMRFPCSQKRQGQSMKLRHARLKTASCDLWCTCSASGKSGSFNTARRIPVDCFLENAAPDENGSNGHHPQHGHDDADRARGAQARRRKQQHCNCAANGAT